MDQINSIVTQAKGDPNSLNLQQKLDLILSSSDPVIRNNGTFYLVELLKSGQGKFFIYLI